jgi:hypothetical protein
VRSQVAWTDPEPLALYGGTLATAGNLDFYGTLDWKFKTCRRSLHRRHVLIMDGGFGGDGTSPPTLPLLLSPGRRGHTRPEATY